MLALRCEATRQEQAMSSCQSAEGQPLMTDKAVSPISCVISRVHVSVQGVVQGIGFRPFVYRLARSLGLSGWVSNTADGVEIEVEGRAEQRAAFLDALQSDAPPLAHIAAVDTLENASPWD